MSSAYERVDASRSIDGKDFRALFRLGGVIALLLGVGACAATPQLVCRPGEHLAVVESLYFGTARPDGVVTAQAWSEFVDLVMTPRFPEGLTSWEASGQWRNGTGRIEKESSRVLIIAQPDAEENDRAVREIMSAYKTAFQQEAVLRVRSAGCLSF